MSKVSKIVKKYKYLGPLVVNIDGRTLTGRHYKFFRDGEPAGGAWFYMAGDKIDFYRCWWESGNVFDNYSTENLGETIEAIWSKYDWTPLNTSYIPLSTLTLKRRGP